MSKKKSSPKRQPHKARSTTSQKPTPELETATFDEAFKQGTNLLHAGKNSDAVTWLERAHAADPDHLNAALNLGGAYILTKKFKQARALLEPISETHPEISAVWINLGAAYLGNPILARDEEQLQAIAAFERALDIDPIAPSVAYNIGLVYRDRKDVEQARYWFQQAIQHNPNDQDARRILERLNNQTDTDETEPTP